MLEYKSKTHIYSFNIFPRLDLYELNKMPVYIYIFIKLAGEF